MHAVDHTRGRVVEHPAPVVRHVPRRGDVVQAEVVLLQIVAGDAIHSIFVITITMNRAVAGGEIYRAIFRVNAE